MELMVNKQAVTINETVYDGCVQQPVETDLMLPDYCPDILRVLRCDIQAAVMSKQMIGEKVAIDGIATLKLIYLDDGRCLRSHEHKLPFTTAIDIKTAADNAMVETSVSTDYVNCRPVSPRRLDVKGSLSVCAKVTALKSEQIVSEAAGMNVELKRKMLQTSRMIANVNRSFSVKEEMEVPGNKAPIASIIRANGVCVITDYKVIANKVILKGELTEHILYACDEKGGGVDTLEYTMPVSQIIDVDGVDENSKCAITLGVNGITADPKANNEGEAKMVALNADISYNVKAFANNEVPAVVDMYSTKYESAYQAKPIAVENLNGIMNSEYTVKNVFDMPDENIGRVLDVWSEVNVKGADIVNDEMTLVGTIKTGMLVEHNNGENGYYERTSDLEYRSKVESPTPNMTANANVQVKDTQFNMPSRDKIEVRSTLDINAAVMSAGRESVLTEISVNDKAPKKQEEAAALTIYFAEKGESVWDIAKRYNTSAQQIVSHNELADESLKERCMLLIPTFAISDEN